MLSFREKRGEDVSLVSTVRSWLSLFVNESNQACRSASRSSGELILDSQEALQKLVK